MKRLLVTLAILVVAISPVNAVYAGIRGDANRDGSVNMADITTIELGILEIIPLTPNMDVNGNGIVDMGDVVGAERIILGIDHS